MQKTPNEQKSGNERLLAGRAGQASALGTNLVVGMGLFTFIGYYIDRKHGGGIFWTLVGMFLGLIYGAYEFWIVVRMLNRADDDHHGTGNGKKKGT